jgi:hypothetical protein
LSRRVASVLALAILVGSLMYGLAVHLSNPVLPEDDAYITYRYSDNLLNGQGLVYNPGQRVFGTSTPLYAAWLAGLHGMVPSVPTPELSVRVNFVFYALTILGIFFLLASLGRSVPPAALLAGLLAMNSSLLRASLGGMETFLFTGLLVWSLWAIVTGRFRLGAWLAGISVLARPEGTLLVALIFASRLTARRDWRELVGLLLPGLAWVAFATPYYGTPIYHSILAKSRPLYPLPAGSALNALFDSIAFWTVGGRALWHTEMSFLSLPLLVFVLVAAVFGYVKRVRSRTSRDVDSRGQPEFTHRAAGLPDSQPLVRGKRAGEAIDNTLMIPALLALFVFFYAVSNPLLLSWYYPPVQCLWFTALAAGAAFAGAWLKDRAGPRFGLLPVLGLAALTGVSALTPLLFRIATRRLATDLKLESSPDRARTVVYRSAAEWLNRVVPPGDTLVAPEIGSLGYYYRGYVFDACGLVSPEALPFLPVPLSERTRPDVGAISLELVKHLRFDIVVTMQLFAQRSLYPSDWFHQNYELVRQYELPLQCWWPGGDTVDVFFRRGGRAASQKAYGREPEGK